MVNRSSVDCPSVRNKSATPAIVRIFRTEFSLRPMSRQKEFVRNPERLFDDLSMTCLK
jgi:hypothetical protein